MPSYEHTLKSSELSLETTTGERLHVGGGMVLHVLLRSGSCCH